MKALLQLKLQFVLLLFSVLVGSCISANPGCMDSTACNFDPSATSDGGNCIYDENELFAQDDNYVFYLGDNLGVKVQDNDGYCMNIEIGPGQDSPSCIGISTAGNLFWSENVDETCIGTHVLDYKLYGENNAVSPQAFVTIEVRKAKPDCGLLDMSKIMLQDDGTSNCFSVCENSVSIITAPPPGGSTYVWEITGGTAIPAENPNDIEVAWGPEGNGVITLYVLNGDSTSTYTACVDILPGPTASFNADSYACQGQSVCFESTSIGADQLVWDFGDGILELSNSEIICHEYTTPGTYTVTLSATRNNFDGSTALCCCTDVIQQEILIDPLPGPAIYWVSTLCAGDESNYWTDAVGCDYLWSAVDNLGNPVDIVSGQGTSEINIAWGFGPHGIVSLEVANCDEEYCDNPTEVLVPIIPFEGQIDGETLVCLGATEIYSLPKWPGTVYEWGVSAGGVISATGDNEVAITWNEVGLQTVQVFYTNPFLQGLPNHTSDDCSGSAFLLVNVLDDFTVFHAGADINCPGAQSTFFTQGSPNPICIWSIEPAIPFDDSGSSIDVVWNEPGTYIVTATTVGTDGNDGIYCNEEAFSTVIVVDVNTPVGIEGPIAICPGESAFYTATPFTSAANLQWSLIGGTVVSTSGNSIEVDWDLVGPYQVGVAESNSPLGCLSEYIWIEVNPLDLSPIYSIEGDAFCVNTQGEYTLTPAPDPAFDVVWSLSDNIVGSIISGQESNTIGVQWNNSGGDATLTATLSACDTEIIVLAEFIVTPGETPVIIQDAVHCDGEITTLSTSVGFDDYDWSTGASSSSIDVSTPGIYALNTTDGNGCIGSANHAVQYAPTPDGTITSGQGNVICIESNPQDILMQVSGLPDWNYTWTCNGDVVADGTGLSTFNHEYIEGGETNFTYKVSVFNGSCSFTTDPYSIAEILCPGDCEAGSYSLNATVTIDPSDCSTWVFDFTSSPEFEFTSWTFGDDTGSGLMNPWHQYDAAGSYLVQVHGTVPNAAGDGMCSVSANVVVDVDFVPAFDFQFLSCTEVQFINLSTISGTLPVTDVDGFWIIDGNIVTDFEPVFDFPGEGSYPVILEMSANGCTIQVEHPVTIEFGLSSSLNLSSNEVCTGENVHFTSAVSGATSYLWEFGDGASYSGPFCDHSYVTSGTYTVEYTVSNDEGCEVVISEDIIVHQGIDSGLEIDSSGDMVCEGGELDLTAPAGFTYLWSNGNTTQTISVGAGEYTVEVSDGQCSSVLGPITVEAYPVSEVVLIGNPYICDAGCTSISFSGSFTGIEWYVDNVLDPMSNTSAISICDPASEVSVFATMEDQYGCIAQSNTIDVSVVASPTFVINSSVPLPCAGEPVTFTVDPIDIELIYLWNTGHEGPEITTYLPGNYSVEGTHIESGCSGFASTIVYPIPDFCVMNTGCYDVCIPDSICGPIETGMEYQWNLNEIPLLDETEACIEFMSSGSYTLTATNVVGCTATSEQLIVEVSVCDSLCENVDISLVDLGQGAGDNCCFAFDYINNSVMNLGGVELTYYGPGPFWDVSSLDPSFTYDIAGATLIIKELNGNALPTGAFDQLFGLCVEPTVDVVYYMTVAWFDENGVTVCEDLIEISCPEEPECVYVNWQNIYCEDGQVHYEMEICNPSNSLHNFSFFDLVVSSPAGYSIDPPFGDMNGLFLAPGDCEYFHFIIGGNDIGGELFCYELVGHEFNPNDDPTTFCCTTHEVYCIEIPFCNPCDLVGIQSIDSPFDEDCCYDVIIYNNFEDLYFDQIMLNVLTPNTDMSVNNPPGSMWGLSNVTSTSVFLNPVVNGGFLPLGTAELPEICITTNAAPYQSIQVLWMRNGQVVCEEIMELWCDPECGYLEDVSIDCSPNSWDYSGTLYNTSNFAFSKAVILFDDPALSAYNTEINTPSIAPGQTYSPLNFSIGSPALAGETVCFTVTIHEAGPNGVWYSCCSFEHCIELPPCEIEEPPCNCDSGFLELVDAGFTFDINNQNSFEYTFTMVNAPYFYSCDEGYWRIDGEDLSIESHPSWPLIYTFPGPGSYDVCITVRRVDQFGNVCKEKVCQTIIVPAIGQPLAIFPNPSNGVVFLKSETELEERATISIIDYIGHAVRNYIEINYEADGLVRMDLSSLPAGVYMVILYNGNDQLTAPMIIQY